MSPKRNELRSKHRDKLKKKGTVNKILHGGREVWAVRYRSASGVRRFAERATRTRAQEQLEQWRAADEQRHGVGAACMQSRGKKRTVMSSCARIHVFDERAAILGCRINDHNLWVRPGTSDDKAMSEVFKGCYGWREWRPRAGDRYLDFGMNIGSVFCWAYNYKISADLGGEMEYDNFRIASRNLARTQTHERGPTVNMLHGAVVGTKPSNSLGVHSPRNCADHYRHSLVGRPRDISVKARCPGFKASDILEHFGHACVLKLDVEGAEVDILMGTSTCLLPPYIVMEFHRSRLVQHDWKNVRDRLRQAGYEIFVRGNQEWWADLMVFCRRPLRRCERTCAACVARANARDVVKLCGSVRKSMKFKRRRGTRS